MDAHCDTANRSPLDEGAMENNARRKEGKKDSQ